MPKRKIVIVISGGNLTEVYCTDQADVELLDYDNAETEEQEAEMDAACKQADQSMKKVY